jgi:hypothetical protein
MTRIPQNPDPRPKDLRKLRVSRDKFESYVIYETESTQAYLYLFQNPFSEHAQKGGERGKGFKMFAGPRTVQTCELFLRLMRKIHELMTK